jgi:hypothetical protein
MATIAQLASKGQGFFMANLGMFHQIGGKKKSPKQRQ